ncbi:BNR repeat-containing protein [Plebeiibacterium sediminum]|uniref:BNR repeat-containing protein n=1 Tax=Plebeiibacterium sediminum TaxID=2992112 RepID=A0AAE3M510_9BACT|nr:BNR repeat-containing protein [Plebeiobacterium sediminum]MCW3787014.1 BNR repeat-containing protein [Plebeiobacterium sediminum]
MKSQSRGIHHLQFISCVLLIAATLTNCTHLQQTQKTEVKPYEVAREGAWCWFADPRAVHHQNEDGTINKSYIGYIDIHGNIKATQHDFKTGQSNEVLIRSYFQPDDHDNPTFLILPDDRVMIFYSRHTDEPCFYYRISKTPGDITSLSQEYKIPTKFNTTYPSPFILSDDPTHFYICWRGISWHPTIAKFTVPTTNETTECVWGPYQMVQSTASRPYAKYTSNGKDKIMLAYTTGHPDPTMPNYLYYNYIDINTLELKDVKGNVLSKIGEEIYHVAATPDYKNTYPDAVVDPSPLRNWLWQVVLDQDENPAIAMVTISADKTSHDYYYAKWNGESWTKTFLANGGGHFHQSPNIENCYSGGMAIDDQNTSEVYCSVPVTGKYGTVYELIKYVVDDNNTVVTTDTITKDSEFNNARPYIISNRKDSPLKLTWMNGNYYDWIVSRERPLGFCTSIYADYDVTPIVKTGQKLLLQYDDVQKDQVKRDFAFENVDQFDVQLNVQLDTAKYSGSLLTIGDITYGVDGTSLKPYVAIKNQDVYNSTNVLGNSDIWQVKPRSTSGNWYAPMPFSNINLLISYRNNVLTTYINGSIDQVITTEIETVSNIKISNVVDRINSLNIFSN